MASKDFSALDEFVDLVADVRALVEGEVRRGVTGFPKSPDTARVASPAPGPQVQPARARVERTQHAPAPPAVHRPPKEKPPAPTNPVLPASAEAVYSTRQPGTGSPELVGIRKALGECTLCVLSKKRKQIIFGAGNPHADLLIVSEGPTAQEDLQGLPIVGATGEMLTKMLQNVIGLQREEVYIVNVVKCRPEHNRKPRPEEIESCKPSLEQQIRAVSPKVVVVLGSAAAQALLGTSEGVTGMRGAWMDWEGCAVMPTFHPAYLMRSPQDKKLAFQDLKAVRKRYDELGGKRS